MTKYFISKHRIREDAINTWIGATTKAGNEGIEFLGMNPEEEQAVLPTTGKHYANGKRNKGIRGEDLALDVIKKAGNAGLSMRELKDQFKANGFAETSAPSTVSILMRKKLVIKDGDDDYVLAK